MRILVISDSHKRGDIVEKIIKREKDATDIFFLGDITSDIEDFTYLYTDRRFHIVSGNCDFMSPYRASDICTIGGVRIFFTHGHTLGVKYGIERLKSTAIDNNCTVALYGHTHVSRISYEDGLYIVNPGSCSCSREGGNSYAVIDITKGGIMPIIKTNFM